MKKFMIVSLATLALTACGEDSNNDPIENAKQAVADPNLQNKVFEADCTARPLEAIVTGLFTPGEGSVKSSKVQYRFAGSNVTRTTRLYAETNCVGDAFTFEEQGTIDVKDERTTEDARHIDLKFNKLNVRMESDAGVKVAEAISLCDVKDWNKGDEREVTTAAKSLKCYNAQVPRTDSNIYRIENNTLYFGNASTTANGPAERPTTLNTNQRFYAK